MTYNGAHTPCASCKVLPGSRHKADCTGGLHDCQPHRYIGYADGSACYVCGNPRSRAAHKDYVDGVADVQKKEEKRRDEIERDQWAELTASEKVAEFDRYDR